MNSTRLFANPRLIFTAIAAIVGLLMAFLLPVFMAPDEIGHFDRAYQVGEGQLLGRAEGIRTGGTIPQAIIGPDKFFTRTNDQDLAKKPYLKYLFKKIDTKSVKYTDFSSQAVYSPVNYIPQAIGIDIARFVYPSIGTMVFLGRLCNLATYIFLVGLAIRTVKKGKWVYVVIGLFPMALHQASSLSADMMTIALALLWLAHLQNLFMQETRITRQQWIWSLVLISCLALTKQSNILLALPVLFLPVRIFKESRDKLKYVLAVGVLSLFLLGGWYWLMHAAHYSFQTHAQVDPLVSQSLQMQYILHHPLDYTVALVRTYIHAGPHYPNIADSLVVNTYGSFGFLLYSLPLVLTIAGYGLLLVTLLYKDDSKKKMSPIQLKTIRWLSLVNVITLILSLIVIATLEYLTWTEVGDKQVNGLQGRYFIPLLPLLVPVFLLAQQKISVTISKPAMMGGIVTCVAGINLVAMIALTIKWYY